MPDPAQLIVSDSIVGSEGMYDTSTVIMAIPLKLGDVKVLTDSVTAEDVVDFMVRYTATEALAVPDPAATATDDGDSTYGRIQVILPWSEVTIYDERQPSDPDATYVTVEGSRGVVLATDTADEPAALTIVDNNISIDVDSMSRRQYVTLTVHNLAISALDMPRLSRYEDIETADLMDKVQVVVVSDRYSEKSDRDSASPQKPPKGFVPKVARDAVTEMGSDEQATITVSRKTLGELTVAPAEVTAGSKEQNFTITYKVDRDKWALTLMM